MDIRARVNEEMKRRGMRPADLARQVEGKVKARTLYDFLNGKWKGRLYVYPPINSDALGHILDALGMSIIGPSEAPSPAPHLSPDQVQEVEKFLKSVDDAQRENALERTRLEALRQELRGGKGDETATGEAASSAVED